MIKVGDRIKFVSVEKYLQNMAKINRPLKKRDKDIQKEIAGLYDKIIYIEHLNHLNQGNRKLYHTSMPHGGLQYFLPERFEKASKIELSDDLFEI